MDESDENYPGFVFRINGKASYDFLVTGFDRRTYNAELVKKVTIKKTYNQVTISYNDGSPLTIGTYEEYTLFLENVMFGATKNESGNLQRFFKGKLKNMLVIVYEPRDLDYTISFDANGGVGSMPDQTISFGATQSINANTFTREGYNFIGWNTKVDRTGKAYLNQENIKNIGNMTLYAIWEKDEYNLAGSHIFDGTSTTTIDTGITLFSKYNIHKDFDISFTIDSLDDVATQVENATILSVMDEKGTPWPGIVLHRNKKTNNYNIEINVSGSKKHNVNLAITDGMNIVIRRRNGIVSYSTDGGDTFAGNMDFSTFTAYFDNTLLFGAGHDENLNLRRFIKGTLSDIHVKVY